MCQSGLSVRICPRPWLVNVFADLEKIRTTYPVSRVGFQTNWFAGKFLYSYSLPYSWFADSSLESRNFTYGPLIFALINGLAMIYVSKIWRSWLQIVTTTITMWLLSNDIRTQGLFLWLSELFHHKLLCNQNFRRKTFPLVDIDTRAKVADTDKL